MTGILISQSTIHEYKSSWTFYINDDFKVGSGYGIIFMSYNFVSFHFILFYFWALFWFPLLLLVCFLILVSFVCSFVFVLMKFTITDAEHNGPIRSWVEFDVQSILASLLLSGLFFFLIIFGVYVI